MRNIESIIRVDEGIVIEIKGKKIRVVQEDSEITLFLEDNSIIKLVFQQSDIESSKNRESTITRTTGTSVKRELKKPHRRREKIADLLAEGLLTVGTFLTMTHYGKTHFAKVTEDGSIDINGYKAQSPSSACQYVTGRPCSGWRVWYVQDGPSLVDLRWILRAKRFPDEGRGNTALTTLEKQKRMIAVGWVNYALERGLDPSTFNEDLSENYLTERQLENNQRYAESTLANYRRYLRQWFKLYRQNR